MRSLQLIKYIVIHYTANDGDRAINNAKYFANNAVYPKSSAHYFVDDDYIYQSVPDNYVAYSVGSKTVDKSKGGGKFYGLCTNNNSISIEMCDTEKNGVYNVTDRTKAKTIELTLYLMNKYQIPSERVIRHFDVTGKTCPVYWIKDQTWIIEFKSKLITEKWMKDETGWWYRYSDGSYPKSEWKKIDGEDYYFHSDGYMAKDEYIKSENEALYYVDTSGRWDGSVCHWFRDDTGWWIGEVGTNWYPTNEWCKIAGKWYYFDKDGYMVTGTKTIDGQIYSFNKNGELVR
jgi:glucan-binding YG repeat protein